MTNYKILIDNVLDVINDVYKNKEKELPDLTDISLLLDDIEIRNTGKIYDPFFDVIFSLETEDNKCEKDWVRVCSTDPKEKIKEKIVKEIREEQERLRESEVYEGLEL